MKNEKKQKIKIAIKINSNKAFSILRDDNTYTSLTMRRFLQSEKAALKIV